MRRRFENATDRAVLFTDFIPTLTLYLLLTCCTDNTKLSRRFENASDCAILFTAAVKRVIIRLEDVLRTQLNALFYSQAADINIFIYVYVRTYIRVYVMDIYVHYLYYLRCREWLEN